MKTMYLMLVTVLIASMLAACQPAAEPIPTVPTAPTVALVPTDTAAPRTAILSPSPTEQAGWVFPENWWLEPQVWAMSPDSFPDADGNFVAILDYEAYNKAGLTVMSWVQTGESDIQKLHDRGIIVVGGNSMITTYRLPLHPWSEFEGPPELMDAAIRDPYGNIYRDDFNLMDIFGWDVSFTMYSMLHPLWQEHMLGKMKDYIDAGADGYLIDELVAGSTYQPDFNPYTMQLFNTYLLETYGEKELQALGAPWGIEDFSNFDYAALVQAYLPADMTVLTYDDWYNWDITGSLPLRQEFQRFLRIENQKAALYIIHEGRTYAQETYGIYLPVSVNLAGVPFILDGSYLFDEIDFLESEFSYHDYNYFPGARTTYVNKLTRYFDIPLISLTDVYMRPTITAWGKGNTVNLYRTIIADSAASGGAFHIEINSSEINQDMDAIGPYYHFLLDNPPLYEKVEPMSGEIGVLFLWESIVYAPYNDQAIFGLCDLLSDSGYQFSALIGAEEFQKRDGKLLDRPAPPYPLELNELKEFPVIMIPELHYLTDNHAEILMQYIEMGGTLVIFSTQDSTWNMDASNPLLGQILSARGRGATEVGKGKLIHINGVWGKDFIKNPDPGKHTRLIELLEGEGLQPEIRMRDARYLAATANIGPDRMVVHFVNYDHEEGDDITTPTGPVDVEISLPDGFQLDSPALYLFTPGEMPQELDGVINGGKLQLTLPEVYIWSVLLIGEEGILGEQVAALPTLTPTPLPPTPTPTMDPTMVDTGYVIYDDEPAPGWGAGSWWGEAKVDSTAVVYAGTQAVEVSVPQESGVLFYAGKTLDHSPYTWLVFYINIGETTDPVFAVELWYQDNPIGLRAEKILPHVEGGQLEPKQWHQVVIPLSDLNPEGGTIDQINFIYDGRGDTTFYLDEIRLVATEP